TGRERALSARAGGHHRVAVNGGAAAARRAAPLPSRSAAGHRELGAGAAARRAAAQAFPRAAGRPAVRARRRHGGNRLRPFATHRPRHRRGDPVSRETPLPPGHRLTPARLGWALAGLLAAARQAHAAPWLLVIDPGHGGAHDGAVGPGGSREKDLSLLIARQVAALAEEGMPGVKAIFTRDGDRDVELEDRVAFANRKRANLCVSIHLN